MATPRKSAAKKAAAKKAPTAKKAPAARKAPAKRAAAKKTTAAPVRAIADVSVVVQSKIRQVLRDLDMRMDSALIDEVNQRVHDMLRAATERARENRRTTVRPHDL